MSQGGGIWGARRLWRGGLEVCRAGDPLCVLCVEGDGINKRGVPEAPRWLVGVATPVLQLLYSAFMICTSTLRTLTLRAVFAA